MNMMSLVMANEQDKAQFVNPRLGGELQSKGASPVQALV